MASNLAFGVNEIKELTRPWKLFTFFIGMSWLIYGAVCFNISDWDIGISIIMGMLTFLFSSWTIHVIYRSIFQRPRLWFIWLSAALAVSWFTIDGSYWLYHSILKHQMLRKDNFFASFTLYFLAGFIWSYHGSLKELFLNIIKVVSKKY